MSGSVKENIKNDRKRKGNNSIKKDTITPDLHNPTHVDELEWLYKKELKKRGLKGAETRYKVVIDLLTNRFTFTIIIMVLYLLNGGVQLYLKESLWAGYFISCAVITGFTVLLMAYEKL